MGRLTNIDIRLRLFLKKSSDDLRRVGREWQNVKTKIDDVNKALAPLQRNIGRLTGALISTAAVRKAITLAKFQEEVQLKLQAALGENIALYEDLLKFASERQRVTFFTDESTIDVLQKLLAFDVPIDRLQEFVIAVQNIASTGVLSLDAAVSQLAATVSGEVTFLGRRFKEVKRLSKAELERGEAARVINEQLQGLAEEVTKSPFGLLQQQINEINDEFEVLGRVLISVVAEAVRRARLAFGEFVAFVRDNIGPLVPVINSLLTPLEKILKIALSIAAAATTLRVVLGTFGKNGFLSKGLAQILFLLNLIVDPFTALAKGPGVPGAGLAKALGLTALLAPFTRLVSLLDSLVRQTGSLRKGFAAFALLAVPGVRSVYKAFLGLINLVKGLPKIFAGGGKGSVVGSVKFVKNVTANFLRTILRLGTSLPALFVGFVAVLVGSLARVQSIREAFIGFLILAAALLTAISKLAKKVFVDSILKPIQSLSRFLGRIIDSQVKSETLLGKLLKTFQDVFRDIKEGRTTFEDLVTSMVAGLQVIGLSGQAIVIKFLYGFKIAFAQIGIFFRNLVTLMAKGLDEVRLLFLITGTSMIDTLNLLAQGAINFIIELAARAVGLFNEKLAKEIRNSKVDFFERQYIENLSFVEEQRAKTAERQSERDKEMEARRETILDLEEERDQILEEIEGTQNRINAAAAQEIENRRLAAEAANRGLLTARERLDLLRKIRAASEEEGVALGNVLEAAIDQPLTSAAKGAIKRFMGEVRDTVDRNSGVLGSPLAIGLDFAGDALDRPAFGADSERVLKEALREVIRIKSEAQEINLEAAFEAGLVPLEQFRRKLIELRTADLNAQLELNEETLKSDTASVLAEFEKRKAAQATKSEEEIIKEVIADQEKTLRRINEFMAERVLLILRIRRETAKTNKEVDENRRKNLEALEETRKELSGIAQELETETSEALGSSFQTALGKIERDYIETMSKITKAVKEEQERAFNADQTPLFSEADLKRIADLNKQIAIYNAEQAEAIRLADSAKRADEALGREEDRLTNLVELGILTRKQANDQLRGSVERTAEAVQGSLNSIKTFVASVGNATPEVLDLIEELENRLISLQVQAAGLGTTFEEGALKGLQDFFDRMGDDFENARQAVSAIGDAITDNISTGISDVIEGTKSFAQAWRDVARDIINQIQRIIVRLLVMKAISAIGGSFGLVPAQEANKGGFIRRSGGGWVPGSGPDRDSVPALLTPDEFVLRRKAARYYGASILSAMNARRIPRGMLAGYSGVSQIAAGVGRNQGGEIRASSGGAAGPSPAFLVSDDKAMRVFLHGGRSEFMDFLSRNAAEINGLLGVRT